MMMNKTTLAAALIAASMPFGAATAAPSAQSPSAEANAAATEMAQTPRQRHVRHNRRDPGIASGTGMAVGSAFAAPYAYGYPYGPNYYNPGNASAAPVPGAQPHGGVDCKSLSDSAASAYPAWACRDW